MGNELCKYLIHNGVFCFLAFVAIHFFTLYGSFEWLFIFTFAVVRRQAVGEPSGDNQAHLMWKYIFNQ
jgi:hypothetical protein